MIRRDTLYKKYVEMGLNDLFIFVVVVRDLKWRISVTLQKISLKIVVAFIAYGAKNIQSGLGKLT